jgi:DNA-binding NarL/FixJ family response regulator
VADILIASDAEWVIDEIRSALGTGDTVRTVSEGRLVRPTVEERQPDLAVVDFQIGSMGGMAVAIDLRLEAGAGRIDPVPVLLLLDRRPDVFLARRSQVDGWLVKPLDPIRTRTAIRTLLAGGQFHDASHLPVGVSEA